jgi:hypothetical protein
LQDEDDEWNCGQWSHAALELFVTYFKAGKFDGFGQMLGATDGLQPLNLIKQRGRSVTKAAVAVNRAYVGAVRDEMREALRAAHTRGEMPFLPTASSSSNVFFSASWLKGGQRLDSALNLDA